MKTIELKHEDEIDEVVYGPIIISENGKFIEKTKEWYYEEQVKWIAEKLGFKYIGIC